MAEVKFTVANAKTDSVALAEETALAEAAGIVVDSKKGILSVEANSNLENSSSIDISGSALFKTVSIASGYEGTGVSVVGNGTVANTFYAGSGGAYFYGGDAGDKNGKPAVAADKFYGGDGADTYAYGKNGGKDTIFKYGAGDQIVITGYDPEKNSLSFVDKNGGIVVTLSDSSDSVVAKNSVLTVDGKTADSAAGGFKFVDGEGNEILTYGFTEAVVANGVAYGDKKGKADTSSIYIGADASGEVNVGHISSTAKNISAANETNAIYITGNGNANKITIGSAGGTIDGGYGAKATADVLYGTTSAPVVYVYDAQNGGKDTIGDAKLTQYGYKGSDAIVITNGSVAEENIAMKGTDAIITFDKNNVLTIKNALGKKLHFYADDMSDDPVLEYGDVLPDGLNYDAKVAKITADNDVLTSGTPIGTKQVFVETGKTTVNGEEVASGYQTTVAVYKAVTLGADDNSSYKASVKDIDLSDAEVGVIVYTDVIEGETTLAATNVTVGQDGSTVYSSENGFFGQAFTAGKGDDLFVIYDGQFTDTTAKSPKAHTIVNFGASGSDSISIVGATEENLSFVEKGKDLNIYIDDKIVTTVKNYDSDAGVVVLGDDDFSKSYPKKITGVGYGVKNNKIDKTSITLSGSVGSATVSAEDFGGSAIKTVNAADVTAVSGNALELYGSDAANSMIAPTATNIKATLSGGAGNDNYTSGGGATTYVFTAQARGKKDVITGFKSGDVIMVDLENIADSNTELGEGNSITYDGIKAGTSGFNDSKADVVINLNAKNTITVKNGAGKAIVISDGTDSYEYGHVLPDGLSYDAKNTAVTVSEGASYNGEIVLSDTAVYYSTIKKVDLTGNSGTANIYGNTLANEFIAGDKGGILDGGSVVDLVEENPKIKPTADKLTGGSGADIFVYDVAYGKDSFLKFGSEDVVSLGAGIDKSDLTITNKGNVLTVAIGGDAVSTEKGALNTTANSTFTISLTGAGVPVKFTFADEDVSDFVYGSLPSGASLDAKSTTLSISTDAAATVDAGAINSQPKVIDGRGSSSELTLIGNGNADQIYGGSGTNVLFGGTAGTKAVKDQLYGGSGKDYFLFSTQGAAKGKETDIVNNYVADDVIVLESAPDSIKADGKAITLTWNETPEGGTKAVASTLVINGAAQDATMKKFNPIDQNVAVTFMINDFIDDDGSVAFDASSGESVTYQFDLSNSKSDNAKALKKGVAWSDVENYLAPDTTEGGESEEAQLAAYDWFENAVATDNVAVSELDSILETKAITADAAEQFNGDAFFTGVGQADQSASQLAIAARHRAKK